MAAGMATAPDVVSGRRGVERSADAECLRTPDQFGLELWPHPAVVVAPCWEEDRLASVLGEQLVHRAQYGQRHDVVGAYGDDEMSWREHVHDYTGGSCCGRTAPSWVSSDVLGLLDNTEEV